MNKRIFGSCIVSNRTFEVKWVLLCYVIASFASLFFLSISSSEQVDLVNVLCYLIWHVRDLFLKFYICNDYNLQPSSVFFFSIWFSPLCFLLSFSLNVRCGQSVSFEVIVDPSIVSPCLNYRQCNDLENIQKIMISMYLSVLISNAMTRQHEQNMTDLNKQVFPSWQINERKDIVKLTCFFQELNKRWIAHHK